MMEKRDCRDLKSMHVYGIYGELKLGLVII